MMWTGFVATEAGMNRAKSRFGLLSTMATAHNNEYVTREKMTQVASYPIPNSSSSNATRHSIQQVGLTVHKGRCVWSSRNRKLRSNLIRFLLGRWRWLHKQHLRFNGLGQIDDHWAGRCRRWRRLRSVSTGAALPLLASIKIELNY